MKLLRPKSNALFAAFAVAILPMLLQPSCTDSDSKEGAGPQSVPCAASPLGNNPSLAGLAIADRREFERAVGRGGVVVAYGVGVCSAEFNILADCRVDATYSYRPRRTSFRDLVTTPSELTEKAPLGVTAFHSSLEAEKALRIDEERVGFLRLQAGVEMSTRSLVGEGCEGASHIVSHIDIGGGSVFRGQKTSLEKSSSLFRSPPASTADFLELEYLGNPDRCAEAIEGRMPAKACAHPIRVRLVPLKTIEPGEEAPEPKVVRVPAGRFWMGSNRGLQHERPKRRVWLDAFSIGRLEVSAEEYAGCVESGACTKAGTGPLCTGGVAGLEQHPINCVTWKQAVAYCAQAGQRLPTEAEWERAARGTGSRQYVWGNRWPPRKGQGNFADSAARAARPFWHAIRNYTDGYAATAPVGTLPKARSSAGVMDMEGNVLEWTADFYGARSYKEGGSKNPRGPDSGPGRVVRGGTFAQAKKSHLRVTHRQVYAEHVSSMHIGFRCAE